MNSFIFILGKNPELSSAEIVAYMDARDVPFSIEDSSDEFLVISAPYVPDSMASDLGGMLKFGEVLGSASKKEDLLGALESANWGKVDMPSKPLFAVSSYGAGDPGAFEKSAKESLRQAGIKAGMLSHTATSITHTEIVRRKLYGRELLLCKAEKFWLGRMLTAHDPYEFKKRDVGRPVQRAELSMPPRLSRIMLNLSGKPGRVLDPFCGLGTVLQEAATMGFEAHGSDVDNAIVSGCVKDMEWFSKAYKTKHAPEVRLADARNLPWSDGHFDAIVTEPVLGPVMKRFPKTRQAEAIVRKLTPLYRDSIKEMIRILKKRGRLVMTSPMFRVHNMINRIDVAKIAAQHGADEIDVLGDRLKHAFPLTDFEPQHMTLREVHVFQKR